MGVFGTGQAIRRKEDERFLRGEGLYTDDITLDRQAYLYVFRSPYAHGTITELDVSHARDAADVLCVLTADDLTAAGVQDLPGGDMPKSSLTDARAAKQQPPLARGRVRYVGEPVAGVVATSIAAARDAAELIEFDVDELDATVQPEDAQSDSAVLIHDDVAGNSLTIQEWGNRDATDKAFESASHVVEIRVENNRLAPTAMESRACNASFDPDDETLTLYQGCQGVHFLRDLILKSIDLPKESIHIISPDVGGAFGLKFFLQCETIIAIAASMQLGQAVKWTAERSESFLSDLHGRDQVANAKLAIDENGRFLAMRSDIVNNAGAYCSNFGPLVAWWGACMTTGVYDIPAAYATIESVLTNTVPTDAYRGAGRPEAAYQVERLVSKAAIQLDIPQDEIRRRNFIQPTQFPYTTPTQRVYDSGDYEAMMDKALQRSDWAGFAERRKLSAKCGKLRGIGLSSYVEICSAGGSETSHVRFEENGRVTLLVGTQASGQGHETSYAQMVGEGLGVSPELIDVVQGDTHKIPSGGGTGGSRSMVMAGSSLFHAVETLIESGRNMAAELLESAVSDIQFSDGRYRIAGTDRLVGLTDVAAASYKSDLRPDDVEPGLYSNEEFTIQNGTFPNGCHVCEVEIDPDTGSLDILRYTIHDDVGTVVNPLILEGQIVGGVAQGLGQACGEHAVYDRESGQLVTATFMDYTMPRADTVPDVDFSYTEIASPTNPLGIKGAGEAGTVGSTPALINAVLDALSVRGIRTIDMPLNPLKLWDTLRKASA